MTAVLGLGKRREGREDGKEGRQGERGRSVFASSFIIGFAGRHNRVQMGGFKAGHETMFWLTCGEGWLSAVGTAGSPSSGNSCIIYRERGRNNP